MRKTMMSLALGLAFQAHGADISFTGLAPNPAERSFWDIATNWSTSTVPGPGDNALLGNFTVVQRLGAATATSFSSGATGSLSIIGGSLTYSAASSVAQFAQSTGTLSGPADATFTTSAALNGGAHSGVGTTLVGSGAGPYTVGSVRFDNGRTLRNTGTLTQSAGAGFFDFHTDTGGSARFVNEGTFNITTGSVRGIDTVGSGLPVDVVRNTGTINKTGSGSYVVAAPLDQRGTFNITDGTVFFNADSVLRNASTTGGAGLIVINGSVMTVESGAQMQTAKLQMDFGGARLNYSGNLVLDSLVQNSGAVVGTGQLSTLGAMTLNGGAHSGVGTTLVGSGAGPYTVGSVRFDNGRTLRNTGTLTQSAGAGFFDFHTDTGGSARFVNEGTFNITTGSVRGIDTVGSGLPVDVVRNTGTINKTGSGSYVVAAPLDQRGTFNITDGTVFFNADSVLRNASTTGGAGLIVINGSVMTVESGAQMQTAKLQMDFGGARLNYSGNLVLDSLVQNSGAVVGTGQLSTLGAMTLNGGAHSGVGTTLVGSGAGPYTVGSVRFDNGRTLRNTGTLTQSAGAGFFDFHTDTGGSARFVNEGTFNITTGSVRGIDTVGSGLPVDVVRNTGTINKTGSGSYVVAAPLDQRGTFNITDGTVFFNADSVLRNASTTGGAGLIVINGSVMTVESGAQMQTAKLQMDFGGARLNYSGNLVLDSLVQNSGAVVGTGQLSTLGAMTLNGGAHSGVGTTLVGSGAGPYTVGSVRFDNGRTLRNTGTLTQSAGAGFFDFHTDTGGSARFVNEGTFNITTGSVRGIDTVGSGLPVDVVRNTGTINKTGSGSYVVAAPLDQRGTFNITDGTVFFNAAATHSTGVTRVATGATAVLNGTQMTQTGGTIVVDGSMNADFGNGRLVMQGGVLAGNGTFTDNAYGGPTDHAIMNIAGRIAPGDHTTAGTLTLDAGLMNGVSGVLEIDILDGSTFDRLQITRASALAGTIDVDPLGDAFVPIVGDRFLIATLDAGYTGTFSAVTASEPFGGMLVTFSIAHNSNSVELVVGSLAPIPEPETYALLTAGLVVVIWRTGRNRKVPQRAKRERWHGIMD